MNRGKTVSIVIYLVVVLLWLTAGLFIWKFPAWFILHGFLGEVTQADMEANPHTDYSGYRPGEDIPRLTSMEEYEQGTYTGLDFITVETTEIIPLDIYRLKDPADINSTEQYRGRGRAFSAKPLAKYTTHPARRGYLYGRYYLLKLRDGSQVIAYADRAYELVAGLGNTITFPVGRLQMSTVNEEEMFEKAEETYGVNTERIFYMINDRNISDWNFMDLFIRVTASGIVVIVSFLLLWIGARGKKNRQ